MRERDETDQAAAIAFLAAPATHGIADEATVARVETHTAIVFLAGERAYKLKRSVRFSYLDFSTVAEREAACRAELALNRRTAPELYLAVRSINRRPDGTLAFDGDGPAIDWVVVMRRFEEEELFERLASRGLLTDRLMRELSSAIAAFHAAAERTPQFGGAAAPAAFIDGNDLNLRLATPRLFERDAIDALAETSRRALACVSATLERRRAAGKVRRCHGDLHLRNICLWRGRPLIFDCIEFDESLSCIDVLYDLAFLLMDLRHRGLATAANTVLNAYLDAADESDGLAALPLFVSLRAAIRAHVGAAAARAQSDAAAAAALADEARRYLAMAQDVLRPAAPRLVAVGGLSGSGKSTLARGLAPALGAVPGARILHSDALRKRLFGVRPTERLPPAAYAAETSAAVYKMQRDAAAAALRQGHSVIVDAVFARPEERAAAAALAREVGVPFTGLWLAAPAATLRARIAERRGDISDATVAVLEQQFGYAIGAVDWATVDAGASPRECLEAARRIVGPADAMPRRDG